MTARLRSCLTCTPADGRPEAGRFAPLRGFTRHADRRCAACRRYGPPKDAISWRGRAA